MDCRACGHTNREGRRFCGACGGSLALVCPACGTEDEDGESFCGSCGAELDAPLLDTTAKSAPSSGAPAHARTPTDYTPRHLADKILQSRSAIEGERKRVTVMFADVANSMELAEQLDPEGWHGVLDRFFATLSEGVHRFEGTINQYTGDGIMALFGAPISHEDHGVRACYAAVHLLEELRSFTREVKREHGVDFAVRIGLNSGDVVVGKIGDDLRMDYTAQGHTVGLAQRMESLASAGSAYLSQPTAALVRGYFELEDLGEFRIKGAADPLHVYELLGPGTARTRFDVSRDRGLASFVGRSDEIALLETALEQALAGPGRTIGVAAQAGTGKSRLCYEFVESARRRGVTVYEARGLSHGGQIPLLPIQELMRDFFGIEDRDSDRVVREKIAGRTLLLDETLREELPILFDLLDVPDPDRPLPDADPELLKRRMYAAVRSIVKADGELDPGIVLVEDLHWLDPASDAMLAQIIEANALSKSLMLVNFRPEYRAAWMQQGQYQQLSLLPLREDALRELLRDLLGEDSSVTELPRTIYERTAGNPFFIEEVVQSLIEKGQLLGSRGAYRLVAQLDELRVPESVQSLLASRIDRLGEREKHVVQSASVIGKNFREEILRRVVDLPETDLQAALQALQAGELIYEAALYPDHEYAFKHPLTQEVAERSQLGDRRAQRHAAVARAYEELAPEHLDGRAALLAHHWEHANEPVRAAHWHARAAGRMGSMDYREALAHWRRVDELVRGHEDSMAIELQIRAFIERTLSAFRVEVPEQEAEEVFARGRAFLESRGDDANLARLTSAFSTVRQNRGRMLEYLALAEESVAIARRVGDPALRAFCGLELCYSRWQHGAATGAVEAGDEIVELASGDIELGSDAGHSPLILCMAFTAGPRVDLGRIDEAEERVEMARSLARDQPLETHVWLTLMQLVVHQGRGDADAARRSAQQCRVLAERSGSAFDAVVSHCWLAMALCDCGEWESCVNEMRLGRAACERSGFGHDVFLWVGWAEALAYLRLGDVARARASIDGIIEVATEQQARINLCQALIVRAEIHREAGADAIAEADLERAERLIEETGSRRHRGQILEARGRFAEAVAFYREIGATGHARRVERLIAH